MLRFVVMAAGKASRMGQDKLAMAWGDTTILGHVLQVISDSLTSLPSNENTSFEIQVVARKSKEEYGLSDLGISSVDSWQWMTVPQEQPLADTIRCGIAELPKEIRGVCFIPGDQVGIDPQVLASMIRFFMEKEPDFLVPKEGEATSSPVFFHARYVSELSILRGEQGGKHVLQRYPDRCVIYPVPEGFSLDIDTMDEYLGQRDRFLVPPR